MVTASNLNIVGQTYRGFRLTKAFPIPELQCTLREFIHEATGAQVMHVSNDDPENLFCLSFRTLPDSSDGVAHILEHTVLCGSEKFPVKDPFFSMTRRSLNTFMNAFTGSDFTCYPAASQVPKDFYNLLDVYLDAVFHPLLNHLSFLQEGWRLEFSTPQDPSSLLEYKGVVYNEMKGALSSSTTRLVETVNATLFPHLTYGYNSGGDPKDIPKLTFEKLRDFHRKYYHPSRCLFFFYGNMPIEGHLDFIAQQVLEKTAPESPLPQLEKQPRFAAPQDKVDYYPISSEEDPKDKTMFAFAWLTCHILEQQHLLALSVLEIILMDTDASPLKMALLKSGLCKQVNAYNEEEISEIPFVIIFKGCNPESKEELKNLTFKTLQDIVTQGIPKNLIENAIHQLEFYRSEITGNSAPFGLSLFMRSALLKQHGGQSEFGLMIHSLFEELREKLQKDPRYLENFITTYFLTNPHFACVTLLPDQELSTKEIALEQEALHAIHEKLKPHDIQDILNKSAELVDVQEKQKEGNLNILPKVSLTDVPKTVRVYPLSRQKLGHLDVFHHSCFTNSIVYTDLVFDLPDVAEEELPYVRLFAMLLSQMGSGGRSYAENLEYIQGHTGGVGAALGLNIQSKDCQQFYPSLHLKGKALYRKVDKLFPLLYDIVSSVDFTDIARLKEVILKHYTALESSLAQSAMKYATSLSASGLNAASKISNDWYGLNYYWMIRDLAHHFNEHAGALLARLQNLQNRLLGLEGAHLVLTCDQKMFEELVAHQFYNLEQLPQKQFSKWNGLYPLPIVKSHGRVISSPVAFTSRVIKTVSYVHSDAPALNIAAFLFDNLTLHTRVREQGGAYGAGAVCSTTAGQFYFYSYRDPQISNTLTAFEDAVQEVVAGNFDNEDLEEAKLEMIQSMDSPIAPGSRGELAYGWFREGRTQEMRQAFRDKLLQLTNHDIQSAVEKHILPNLSSSAAVVFAGRELLEKEEDILKQQGKNQLTSIEVI